MLKTVHPSSSRRKKLRAKRVRLRAHSLRVERLECRRLLSAAPGRVNLDNGNARLDALVENSHGRNGNSASRNGDFDQNRSQRNSNQSNRNGERVQQQIDLEQTDSGKTKGDRDNRSTNNRSTNNRGFLRSIELRNDFKLKSDNPITSRFEAESLAQVDIPVSRITSADSLSESSGDFLAPPNRFSANLSSPLTAQLRPGFELLSSTLPSSGSPIDTTSPLNSTFEPQIRRTTGASPALASTPTSLVAPRVAPPTATVAETFPTATVNIPSAVASSAFPVAFPATTPANLPFADVIAIAAHSLAIADFGVQNQRSEFGVHDTASLLFGGEVDLDRLPQLVDSLPTVIHDTTPQPDVDGLSDGEPTSRDLTIEDLASEDLASEYEPSDLQSLRAEKHSNETGEAHPTSGLAPHQTPFETHDTPTDIVFANLDDDAKFGGVVEMPETMTNIPSVESPIHFDSIVPTAPRIDQIFSQAPLLEIDDLPNQTLPVQALSDQSPPNQDPTQTPLAEELLPDQPLTNSQPQPILIDLRASIPALILCVPALKVQAMKRDRKRGRIADRNAEPKRYPA